MTERYCEICKQIFNGNTSTLEISDDKQKVYITGHDQCVDDLQVKVKSVKDLNKKNVDKVLKEINFTKERL